MILDFVSANLWRRELCSLCRFWCIADKGPAQLLATVQLTKVFVPLVSPVEGDKGDISVGHSRRCLLVSGSTNYRQISPMVHFMAESFLVRDGRTIDVLYIADLSFGKDWLD